MQLMLNHTEVRLLWRNCLSGGARLAVALAAAAVVWTVLKGTPAQDLKAQTSTAVTDPIVFVSRQILPDGSIYYSLAKDLPGVGPHSRVRVAAPGKLSVREVSGQLRTLIDGATPTAATMNLIDVNAPEVSYDGTRIVFAGLPQGNYNSGPARNAGAWRIYVINADGSGLRQVTRSDRPPLGDSFNSFGLYDDTDPAWLPDGRIVFSSTRWPSYAQYSGVFTSNLHVVNADGSGLHRITAERNGADRPLVDPITGKIVYARWWRNHRAPHNDMSAISDPAGGYRQKDGLIAGQGQFGRMVLQVWTLATINPDGTGLEMWSGFQRLEVMNHTYGGAFSSNGDFYGNYFPMSNMSEASGFGGIRRYRRGPGSYTPVIGITDLTLDYVSASNPTSFGIFKGSYAAEPEVLPGGGLVISWAPDINQDYGLYVVNSDGSGRTLLYDNPGTTEVRARLIRPRPLPPIVADTITQVASPVPPPAAGPYTQDGRFVFDCLNVYFNAPVDADIVSAIPVGSAAKIRFFIDHQRTSPGSFPNLDWPILINEVPVAADGSVTDPNAPANVPLFEQIRSADNTIPFTGGHTRDGAAHVAGMNFGRPGAVARCVGCHAGHTQIAVPQNNADAQWTNLAPGAQVSVSSTRDASRNTGLIDRQVMKGNIRRYWTSASGQASNQWARLTFPVPITVRVVRLYNPRQGDEVNSSLNVNNARVRLFVDSGASTEVARGDSGKLAVTGTSVTFNNVVAQAVQVDITDVTGTFEGSRVAGLAEIEVIASGNTSGQLPPPSSDLRVSSLSLTPSTVPAGGLSTGTVTLDGPAPTGGQAVLLSSSNPAVATVPVSVTVPAAATSVTFSIIPAPQLSADASAIVTATLVVSTSTEIRVTTNNSGGTGISSVRFVPIVLSANGANGSFYTSELVLTNRGSRNATARFVYTAAFSGGSGTASAILPAGWQQVFPDAIEYLRSLGIPLPPTGDRGGTLRVEFSNLSAEKDAAITVRTTTSVQGGRAGLSYAGNPASGGLDGTAYVSGLRQNSNARSNLAVQNMGGPNDGSVVLRLTVISGDSSGAVTLADRSLPPGGFEQINGVLGSFSNGYVRVERVSGTAPYYAYGVINDQVNSDGSFVPAINDRTQAGKTSLTLPVVVEANSFTSEIVLTNWSTSKKTLVCSYVADAIQTPGATATFSLEVNASQQLILDDFVQWLRGSGVSGVGPRGPSFAGALFAQVGSGDLDGIALSARTSAPGGGGRYGLFYTAVPSGTASTGEAWLFGLLQDAENRTNLAIINTGETDANPDLFDIELFDGSSGAKVRTLTGNSVGARRWFQLGSILAQYAPGITQAYARIVRTSGANPFIAYAVINDGGAPGQRSGDGAFVASSP